MTSAKSIDVWPIDDTLTIRAGALDWSNGSSVVDQEIESLMPVERLRRERLDTGQRA